MTDAKLPEEPVKTGHEPPPPPVPVPDPPKATETPGSKAPDAVARPAKTDLDGADEASPLLHKGNALRVARGAVTAGLGALFTFFLMSENQQLRFGVPLGIVFIAITAWGIMDLLGTFDDPAPRVLVSTPLRALGGSLGTTTIAGLLWLFALAGAASGRWSQGLWGVIVTFAFLGLVASIFDLGVKLGPWATDELGLARPLWRRHGFWVIATAALLYLPMLGNYSLWDPWETHYGEVAREILSRDDWISLWWAQDGWFWSKPVLDFWIQAVFMATLGVHYKPDQMLIGVGGATAHPEWAVRAPVFLMVVLAMYLLYKGVAHVFGRRAGLLGSLVLATMTDWYMLGHQTMTDMPCVSAMTAAMGLVLLGLYAPEETDARTYEVQVGKTSWRFSAWHLVFGAILLVALPQILYLLSRNLEIVVRGTGDKGFRFHWDEFRSGSAGNCGLPGNEACTLTASASIPPTVRGTFEGFGPTLWRAFGAFEPFLQGLLWSAVLGTLLYVNWGERRIRRLYYLAAWFFAAVATMAKGPEGFGLPILCAFAYVATTKRWKELLRFEMLSGLLILFVLVLPWWVAMYVRHGSPFTDRLIFHDMFNRALHHVHDTNEGDDTSFRFYLWQLGYAFFPWTGLAPLGLVWWARRGDAADRGRGDASVLLVMWFVFAFALFSFMGTKFHHYIFPAVPPVAMLLGVALDDMIGEKPAVPMKNRLIYVASIAAAVLLCVVGVARCFPGSAWGTKPEHGDPAPASVGVGLVLLALGIVAMVLAVVFLGEPAAGAETAPAIDSTPYRGDAFSDTERATRTRDEDRRRGHEQLMVSGAAVAGALLMILIGRDLSTKPDGADQPGAIRLLQLFTYNYRRAWPDTLDFNAVLAGFSVIVVLLGLALAVRKIRRHVIVAFGCLAVLWAAWGLDVYMIKTAPHWGQHEVIQAYYDHRESAEEPLVAYQMNWKGENFYTGNHIPAFVSSGATFTQWLKTQREKGVKVMYFVTEHGRVGGLKSEVAGKKVAEVTDKALDNKFVLVRVEL